MYRVLDVRAPDHIAPIQAALDCRYLIEQNPQQEQTGGAKQD